MRPIDRIAALIPAAGRSLRMGTPKPLLRFGGLTAVEIAANLFSRAGIKEVRVVVGYASEEVIPLLDRCGVKWTLNENHEAGMFSSILVGVRDLDPGTPAFFLLPVDIPMVRPATVTALLDAYRNSRKGILYPRFRNQRGHPPLISTRYIPEDISPDHPGGLRELLRLHEPEALDVDLPDPGVLTDCDTPDDYQRLLRMSGL